MNEKGPERFYDVLHYSIKLSFDEPQKTIFGNVTTTLVPLAAPLKMIEFDAEDISFKHVRLGTQDLKFDSLASSVRIHLRRAYTHRETLKISIDYVSMPKKGAYFVEPDSGYPHKPRQIWTQGEDMDNHHWFPCYDFPDDKATSEVTLIVQSDQEAISNGKLASVKEDRKAGTKTFHWEMNKPHSSYLVMFAVGDYAVLTDKAGSVPLEYYVYKNETADARECFKETPKIMEFFSKRIGYPYPWEKYAQVCIADFMYGGMENTTATTLADYGAVYNARARIDNSPVSLIAHELAHQWWGDVVTCKNWRHLWLNEGFASYFDPLYFEYSRGRDEFDYVMYKDQQAALNTDKTLPHKPIVSVGSYGVNVYSRGAAVLHMLRFTVGDSLFWSAIRRYIVQHQFTPVETNDLRRSAEEASGKHLGRFFDQWVYKAGHPIFDVRYKWSDSARTISLTVRQTQSLDSLTGVFQTPVDIEVTTATGNTTHRITIASRETTVTLPCPDSPWLVIFDKGNWLLKELTFEKSKEEWAYQAQYANNPIDRVRAIQHFVAVHDSSVIPLLAAIARTDNFWGVRVEAIKSADSFKMGDNRLLLPIRRALFDQARNTSSGIRSAAVSQLKDFSGRDVVSALYSALQDSSYTVVAEAIRSLANVNPANATSLISAQVNTPSYRNIIGNAALNALAAIDPDKAIDVALEKVRHSQDVSERRSAVSILTRVGGNRKDVLAAYAALLSDKNLELRSSAVVALSLAEYQNASRRSFFAKLVDAFRHSKLIAGLFGLLIVAFAGVIYSFLRTPWKTISSKDGADTREEKKNDSA
jgi:aminopeptidase N